MKKKAFASSIILGVLVFAAIFIFLDPEKMIEHLMKMDPTYLALALILQFLSLLIVSIRWRWFINATGYKTSRINIFLISLAGQAMNSITPASRWGGEPVKAYLLKKKQGIPISEGMASIIVEKITDIIAFTIIALFAIVYGFFYFNVPLKVMALLIITFFSTLSILFALFYVSFFKRIQSETILNLLDRYKWLTDRIPIITQYKNQIESSLNNYYTTVSRISSKKRTWVVGILFSLGFWIIEISRAYVIFLAFGISPEELPITVIATAYVVSSMIGSIPFLPGDLGIVEGTMILIYSTMQIPVQIGGLVTLIDRFFSYWLVIIVGLPVTWYLGIASLKKIPTGGDLNVNENGSSKRLEKR